MRKRGQKNALDIQLKQQDIFLKNLPSQFKGYTLLLLSDLHLDMNPDMTDALINAIEGLDYDVCVLTGDYRAKTWGNHLPAMKAIEKLNTFIHQPAYAVLGNHDTIRMVPYFEDLGIKVLVNESVVLNKEGATVYLAGIDDPHYYRADNMELACNNIPRQCTSILLSHSPEMYKQAAFADFDLMLCGHTHGGQVCLPGGIPLLVNANCSRRYIKGLWKFSKLQGYTSVGSGASVVDVRINCPPEVTLIRLQPEQ
jgi:predicted MPP superfamily phosphohydrolase